MYLFALLALPLGFMTAATRLLSGDQRVRAYRTFAKGAVVAVPALLAHRILAFLYAPAYGSWMLPASFLLDWFLLPFALLAGAVVLVLGRDPRRTDLNSVAAFAFGFMSAFAGAEAIGSAGYHNHVFAFYLPVWLFAFTAYAPHLWLDALREGMPGALKQAVLAFALFLAAAFATSLAQTRHEFLGFLAFLASAGGTGTLAFLRWRKLGLSSAASA